MIHQKLLQKYVCEITKTVSENQEERSDKKDNSFVIMLG